MEEQKISLDLRESQHRPKYDWKAHITLLVPVFTTVILAGTLFLQTYQSAQAEKDKKAVAWADAIKLLSESGQLAPAPAILQDFLKTDGYKGPASEAATQILETTGQDQFKDLFRRVFETVSWKNLPPVIDLDRTLWSELDHLYKKSYDGKFNDVEHRLSKGERDRVNNLEEELKFVTATIALVLKDARNPRPSGFTLDLHSTGLLNGDFQGADLSGAILDGASLTSLNLKDANLSQITKCPQVRFFSTAWWQASQISAELLECLAKYYPFDRTKAYAFCQSLTQADYDDGVARLRRSARP